MFLGFLKGVLIAGAAYLGLFLFAGLAVKILGPVAGPIVLGVVLAPAYFLLVPFLMHGKMRFRLARTSWSNVRFRFDGEYKELAILFAKSVLLIVVTLGFYTPVYLNRLQAYFTNHATIGKTRFGYRGKSGEFFWLYLKGMLLSTITLGVYYPWFLAKATRYVVDHTTLEGRPFASALTGGQMFRLLLGNLFLVVCTFGLAMPVAINRFMRVFFGSVVLHSDESILQGLLSQVDPEASALAGGLEQAAEALDAVSGIL